jgi:hypothetical protein
MAYNSNGLICLSNTAGSTLWLLRSVDALTAVVATGYISDAGTAGSGKGVVGRGCKVGDVVHVQVVDDVDLPTTCTGSGTGRIATVNATTGVGTLTLDGT